MNMANSVIPIDKPLVIKRRKGIKEPKEPLKDPIAATSEDRFVFGHLQFGDSEEEKVKRRGPHQRDVKSRLKKAEHRLAQLCKLAKRDTHALLHKHDSYAWKKALMQAQGEKVQDDVHVLKKSLKRKEKLKDKRKKVWKEKLSRLTKEMKERQIKRKENLAERKAQTQSKGKGSKNARKQKAKKSKTKTKRGKAGKKH